MFIAFLLCSSLVAAASLALAFHRQRQFEQLLTFTQRLLRRENNVSSHSRLVSRMADHPGVTKAIGRIATNTDPNQTLLGGPSEQLAISRKQLVLLGVWEDLVARVGG